MSQSSSASPSITAPLDIFHRGSKVHGSVSFFESCLSVSSRDLFSLCGVPPRRRKCDGRATIVVFELRGESSAIRNWAVC